MALDTGGVVSTIHDTVLGCASTWPIGSVANTVTTCVPSLNASSEIVEFDDEPTVHE